MIGRLKGVVDRISEDHLILDVGGVGYRIFCTKFLRDGVSLGDQVSLEVVTQVREDRIHLYGFSTLYESEWFHILLTVQGVGSRMALAILSYFSPSRLMEVIRGEDAKAMQGVSGVGPKLALRILRELQSIVAKQNIPDSANDAEPSTTGGTTASSQGGLKQDVISALVNLGYDNRKVDGVVDKILKENPSLDIEEVIKLALREMM